MEVITARPQGMSYDEYKVARRENKEKIQRHIKYGRTHYVSWRYTEIELAGVRQTVLQKFPPFVGSVRKDLVKPV